MEDHETEVMDSKKRAQRARKRLERERQSDEKRRLERIKDKGRKILKRTKLIKESKESKHNVSKQAHTKISDKSENNFEEEKITVGRLIKRDIRNMNDEEKRAYQRARKSKIEQERLRKSKGEQEQHRETERNRLQERGREGR